MILTGEQRKCKGSRGVENTGETDVHCLTANANPKHEQFLKGDLSWEVLQPLLAHVLFIPNKKVAA